MRNIVIAMLFFGTSNFAIAQEDVNKHVSQLGVEGVYYYFSVVEGLSINCQYDVIYSPINTDYGKITYSNIVSVKEGGGVLSRIEYTQRSDGSCHLDGLEIRK